jgi:hypothetical protein
MLALKKKKQKPLILLNLREVQEVSRNAAGGA